LREPESRAADQSLLALLDDLLALYKGPFLPDESEQPAFSARREQARERLLRAVSRVAKRWEESGRGDAAIDCYLRFIDADEQYEHLYRNLMLCCQRRGDPVQALATYGAAARRAGGTVGAAPSPETQALYASLRA
jgi:DNA-binding SARP family transcriptional activator